MCSENDFEILSPAGSLVTLKAAVLNGADAVYIGGQNFSARKNAVNFTDDEIAEGIRYAHLSNVKVYVAVNILIHDFELKSAFDYIAFLYNAGADALIVQDLGIVYMIRKYFPDFHIHASTQMTIHNLEGAKAAKRLGFKRVVLSRELSFKEIKNISDNCDIELEVFVHGALCMSYSGQCLMSSFLGSRSGNRGACAQPCRLPYALYDNNGKALCNKGKYPLSLKDLCLIDEMDMLSECRVKSLKIEGRMKNTEYVSIVTAMYNKYRSGLKVSDKDFKILENVFSRSGFTKGYLYEKTGREMLNFDKNNDNVYNNINNDVIEFAKNLSLKKSKKMKLSAEIKIELGKPAYAHFWCDKAECEVFGSECAKVAENKPLTKERVLEQISKTGNTSFEIEKCDISIDDNINIPIRELNEIRRKAILKLEDLICSTREFLPQKFDEAQKFVGKKDILWKAEVKNLKQAEVAINCGFDKIIVPYELYDKSRKFFNDNQKKISVILPNICRDNIELNFKIDVDEIYASNISQIEKFKDKKVFANFTMNVFNSLSLRALKNMGAYGACISCEVNAQQLEKIDSYIAKELVVYGRIPLMTIQNCAVKSVNKKCTCTDDAYYLKDRKGVDFPLFTNKGECTNTIYNSLPIYMADRLNELPVDGTESFRFIFTVEKAEEIKTVFHNYKNNIKSTHDFTRGHYYRGV